MRYSNGGMLRTCLFIVNPAQYSTKRGDYTNLLSERSGGRSVGCTALDTTDMMLLGVVWKRLTRIPPARFDLLY